ncbi:hypothetical protein NP493_1056g00001 [Ridgeia piscesae]|uniref:SOCS box domain-containing protein n=1 Tax=Ridgeia piscesae TaxID=27915 RepID=A0AAD9KH87_RIDPI|nr:hypothetical protein NP493_1056g00001 [Ridgeia piscesae]
MDVDDTAAEYEVSSTDEDGSSMGDPSTQEIFLNAVLEDDLDTAAMLAGCSDVNVSMSNGASKKPMFLAVKNASLAMVKLLLGHNADMNETSYSSAHCTYETPIVTAVRLQHKDIVEFLLERGCHLEPEACPRGGKTALHWAATYGDITTAELLMSHGADVNWIGPYFQTALHYATIAEKAPMVTWLLHNGAEITVNGDGRSPLHLAAASGDFDIVKQLLAHKCEVNIRDDYLFTPLSLASVQGHLDIVRYLMDIGQDAAPSTVNSAFLKATERGHVNIMEYLFSKGADVNAVNSLGESALSFAARGQYDAVVFLLDKGANLRQVDHRGYTPLQLSLLREQTRIAITLIQHGCLLSNPTQVSETPLQIAYQISNPLVMKCLLQAGCPRERWLNTHTGSEKLAEVDFQNLRSLGYHAEIELQKDVWLWIISRTNQPMTLAESCRVKIRQRLVTASGGSSILKQTWLLPLPPRLQQYLTLETVIAE